MICIFLCLVPAVRSVAQNAYYNLNIDNGLPSNHVYSTITDHLGYLWIATDNGVVKYNGYDFKVFTTQDGLPKNDVWQLLEDRKGRIWLGCISDRFGYIYNDKYYDAVFADTKHQTIYPSRLSLFNDHIAFTSSYQSDNLHPSFFIERNDTIYRIDIARKLKAFEPSIKLTNNGPIDVLNCFISNKNAVIYYSGNLYAINDNNRQISLRLISTLRTRNHTEAEIERNNEIIFAGNHLFCRYYNLDRQKITYINIQSGIVDTVNLQNLLGNEPILYLYYNASNINEEYVYAFSASHAIKISTRSPVTVLGDIGKEINISDKIPLVVNSLTTYPVWNNLLATPEHGLSVLSTNIQKIQRWTIKDLWGFKHITCTPEEGFWINDAGTKLLQIADVPKIIDLKDVAKINYILKKDNDTYLLLGQKNYLLNAKTKNIKLIEDSIFSGTVFQTVKLTNDDWFCISNFDFYRLNLKKGIAGEQNIDIERYNEIIHDKARNMLWVYNQNSCLFYNLDNETKIKITGNQLTRYGTNTLEKICLDEKFGNVFIYGDNKLILYDYEANKATELSKDIYLDRCSIRLYEDVLVLYGTFGIQFYRITGKGQLSKPVLYKNLKGTYYNYIKDIQLLNDIALFTTDKGTFSANIPQFDMDTSLNTNYSTGWQFAVYYKDDGKRLTSGDTLLIDVRFPAIRFDAINAEGVGKVLFNVVDGSAKVQLAGSEYVIPSKLLRPDNYYTITLTAHDKTSRSRPIILTIYIVPKWYQTKTMVKFIWIISGLAFILVISIAILITRRLVLNASKKRNLRMELELKSIYAQINPHFIFNSLNSALLLVSKNKTEEAYSHISKFSKLLRSYIKSSRNKLILLSDEIKNLTNYIDLQQVRFKDKFSYSIDVAPGIEASDIYIPSLLLQPFVENAIEHGLLSKEISGHLSVKFHKKGNKLLCIIEDDGVGRKESKLNKIPNPVKDESYGELLIKDLVNIFNKYEHMNIHVSYTDKISPKTGTVVTIQINIAESRNDK